MKHRGQLDLHDVEASYGSSQVLFGVSLAVQPGECITLIGRNGMGKTTTVKSIMGMLRPRAGRITMDGKALVGEASWRAARAGLGLVPEGRQIFPNLSVRENLVMGAFTRSQDLPPSLSSGGPCPSTPMYFWTRPMRSTGR